MAPWSPRGNSKDKNVCPVVESLVWSQTSRGGCLVPGGIYDVLPITALICFSVPECIWSILNYRGTSTGFLVWEFKVTERWEGSISSSRSLETGVFSPRICKDRASLNLFPPALSVSRVSYFMFWERTLLVRTIVTATRGHLLLLIMAAVAVCGILMDRDAISFI